MGVDDGRKREGKNELNLTARRILLRFRQVANHAFLRRARGIRDPELVEVIIVVVVIGALPEPKRREVWLRYGEQRGGREVVSSRFWCIAHCTLLFGRRGVHQITSIALPTLGVRRWKFQLGRTPIEPSNGRAHGIGGSPGFGGIAYTTLLDNRGGVHQIAGSTLPSILLLRGRLQPSSTPIKFPVSGGGGSRGRTRCVVSCRGWESGGIGAGTGLVGDVWYGRG